MNIKELIEKYKDLFEKLHVFPVVAISRVLEDLRQLDEPQKVQVPQFVADWINKCKVFEHLVSLSFALNPVSWEENRLSDECIDWLKSTSNQELFARAWLDGYTVEKEKYYKIEVIGVSENNTLIHDKTEGCWFFEDYNNEDPIYVYHTRKELEDASFDWVFDCPGIEIEEVEDE